MPPNDAADNPPAGQPLASWPAGRVHPLVSVSSTPPASFFHTETLYPHTSGVYTPR
jgi:hypothetical protein